MNSISSIVFWGVAGLFIVGLVGALYAPAGASEWSGFHDMDRNQLEAQVSLLRGRLNKNPDDYHSLKGLGVAYHSLARLDSDGYAQRAVEVLRKLEEVNKSDYEVMCYLGSATTMLANTTLNPFSKLSYVNEGAALMDKAVGNAPDNVSVRMTRALNSRALPAFLGRGDLARVDFLQLADLAASRPEIESDLKKTIYLNLALCLEESGETERAAEYRKMAEDL